MANSIQPYDNFWYANKALERLEKNLLFTKTVSRTYDDEPRKEGQTIRIKKPGGFVAQQYPTNTAQDLTPTEMDLTINQYWHVTFGLGSQEKAYTGEKIIRDHIDPAMQALGERIESTGTDLFLFVGNRTISANPAVIGDLTKVRKALNKRSVPRADRNLALSAELDEEFLNILNFSNANESSEGAQTQREGMLGRKYGLNPYFQEILPTLAASTIAGTGTIAIVGLGPKAIQGAQSSVVTIDGSTTLTGIARKGYTLSFANHSQQYAVVADGTAAGNAITLTISPGLQIAVPDNTVVTFHANVAAKQAVGCAYQSTAFVIATAKLEDVPQGRGVESAMVQDPRTQLAIRVLRWFDAMPAGGGPPSEFMKFECLWGWAVADANRAERYEDD